MRTDHNIANCGNFSSIKAVLCKFSVCVAVLLIGCAETQNQQFSAQQEAQRVADPELWSQIDRQEVGHIFGRNEVASVNIGCASHGVAIGEFYVQDLAYGQAKSNEHSGRPGCTGPTHGSYSVPIKWVPGLNLLVRWSSLEYGRPTWHEKYTTIPPYPETGDLWVHFFPLNDVRVVVSRSGATSAAHPIPRQSSAPRAEVSSHTDVPIEGVDVSCVVHGAVSVASNTTISIENPNFSNPDRGQSESNLRHLSVDHYQDNDQRNLIRGCQNPAGLQVDRVWHANQKIAVFWRRNPKAEERLNNTRDGYIHVALALAVPRYDKPMPAWLHLFPNDEARLVFSNEPPAGPQHPIARGALVPPPEASY